MSTVTIQDTTIQLTKVDAPSYEGQEAVTYRATVNGRVLGTVTKYRRRTQVVSGRIAVGTRERWMWKYEADVTVTRPATEATRGTASVGRAIRLGSNYRCPDFTRTEALTSLLAAVTDLDALAAGH